MAKLEDVLKKRGYTDQELADLAPMLANAKFRKSLEDELTAGEAALSDLDEYDKWFTQEITPEHERLRKEHADALADAAAAKARMEAYQKTTMKKQGTQQDPATQTQEPPAKQTADDKVDPRYVTTDIFSKTADSMGEAIANAVDIVSEHMQLFGQSSMLNMNQLRLEAKQAKKPVREYWEKKYNVEAKRTEVAAKAETEKREALKKELRQELMVEFGTSNPNLQPVLAPSQSPFVARKKAAEGKQPWERNENELAKSRIEKAVKNAAGRGELASA